VGEGEGLIVEVSDSLLVICMVGGRRLETALKLMVSYFPGSIDQLFFLLYL
jgi:hypothetical protein